jgi:site-specific DNA recombinase
LRAATYARVSSDHQAEAGTIDSQIQALLDRAQEDGVTIDEELQFADEGYSGSTLVRPALERLRDLVSMGAIDRLYVHCPDRLSRKYAYQVLLVEELERCGVEVVFLDQDLGQTPERTLLVQVQGMIAEYERAAIRERCRRGKLHAARRGSINVLSKAPYGYRYVTKDEGGGQARYDVVLAEAQVVAQVFRWIGDDRLSLREGCRRLNRQGIPTPTGRRVWNPGTLKRMLDNPAYVGRAAFGRMRTGSLTPRLRPLRGSTGQPKRGGTLTPMPKDQWIFIAVPAIVSEELFEAVQEQLVENRKRCRQSRQGARHLLQGLLVCQQCQYAFCAKTSSRRGANREMHRDVHYCCTGTIKSHHGGQRVCHNKGIRAEELEEEVWNDVCTLLSDPPRLREEYERRLNPDSAATDAAMDRLRHTMQGIKRGMVRITDAYENGFLQRPEFEQRIRRARERMSQLEAHAQAEVDAETQRRELRLVIGRLEEFAKRVAEGLDRADWHTRRGIIRALVREIQIGDESIRIVYRVNPSPGPGQPAGLESRPSPTATQHCCGRRGVVGRAEAEAAGRRRFRAAQTARRAVQR